MFWVLDRLNITIFTLNLSSAWVVALSLVLFLKLKGYFPPKILKRPPYASPV